MSVGCFKELNRLTLSKGVFILLVMNYHMYCQLNVFVWCHSICTHQKHTPNLFGEETGLQQNIYEYDFCK